MIPFSVKLSIYVSFFLTAVFPVLLLLFLILRRKVSTMPLLAGAIALFVANALLGAPLIGVLSEQSALAGLTARLPAWFLLTSLIFALFGEGSRLVARKMLPNYYTFKDAVSFGLGFGVCETLLMAGMVYYQYIILIMASSGSSLVSFEPAVQVQVMEAIKHLAAMNPWRILLGVPELFSVVIMHIFGSVLVFAGVNKAQALKYWLLAVLIHTLFRYTGQILVLETNIWLAQLVLLLLALGMARMLLKAGPAFPIPAGAGTDTGQSAAPREQTPEAQPGTQPEVQPETQPDASPQVPDSAEENASSNSN